MRSLFFGDIESDRVELAGSEGHHAADVMRIGLGEEIDVSDGNGAVALVRVDRVSKGEVAGQVLSRRQAIAATPVIAVAQALTKGEAMSEAIDLMTQVGVAMIIPWTAERSIAQWRGDRVSKSLDRLKHVALAAAKQSRNPLMPTIEAPATSAELVHRFHDFDQVVVLHEEATNSLASADFQGINRVLLVVGPEGGLSPTELANFTAAGGELHLLGPTVLRAAHAGAIASAVCQAKSTWR